MEIEIPKELLDRAARWPDLKRWERRELGQELRLLGLSYREIRQIIPVPRGTLSGWCRDLVLTAEQKARLKAMNYPESVSRERGATLRARNLARTRGIRAAGREEAKTLAANPFWVAGVVAYWAEGSKGKELQFSNSDPSLIVMFMNWAVGFLEVSPERFKIAMHLHDGQDEQERIDYWSKITGLPRESFRKTFFKREGTGHRKNLLYNGTVRIRVDRSGDLFHRVTGWIDWLAERNSKFRYTPLRAVGVIGNAADS